MFTTLELSEYFSSAHTWTYFGNIVSVIQFTLPGVFHSNPLPDVINGNLWTLRPEFYCYAVMTLLMLTTAVYRRNMFTLLMVVGTAALCILNVTKGFGAPDRLVPWHVLVYYFFVGIFLFQWKEKIPYSLPLFVACAIAAYFGINHPHAVFLVAWPVSYMMVFVGATKFPPIPVLQRGDYSYGIYLFGFPVQQALVASFPVLHNPWLLFVSAAIVTLAFSAFSWHFIEKPSLKLKKYIKIDASKVIKPAPQSV